MYHPGRIHSAKPTAQACACGNTSKILSKLSLILKGQHDDTDFKLFLSHRVFLRFTQNSQNTQKHASLTRVCLRDAYVYHPDGQQGHSDLPYSCDSCDLCSKRKTYHSRYNYSTTNLSDNTNSYITIARMYLRDGNKQQAARLGRTKVLFCATDAPLASAA